MAFLTDVESGDPPEEFWSQHPFVALSFHLNGDPQINDDLIRRAITSIPLLGNVLSSVHPVATVYDLLDGEIPVDFRKFLGWRFSSDRNTDFPHFGHPDLCRQHGHVEKLNWTVQLKQGRPFDAFCRILAEENNKEDRCLYPFVILAIALEDPFNHQMTQAAILLTVMLGFDSAPLRITLAALDLVATVPAEANDQKLRNLSQNLLTDEKSAKVLKTLLESALLDQLDEDPVRIVDRWNVVVAFCALYGLERPVKFLERCAQNNQWLLFTLFAHRFVPIFFQIKNYFIFLLKIRLEGSTIRWMFVFKRLVSLKVPPSGHTFCWPCVVKIFRPEVNLRTFIRFCFRSWNKKMGGIDC